MYVCMYIYSVQFVLHSKNAFFAHVWPKLQQNILVFPSEERDLWTEGGQKQPLVTTLVAYKNGARILHNVSAPFSNATASPIFESSASPPLVLPFLVCCQFRKTPTFVVFSLPNRLRTATPKSNHKNIWSLTGQIQRNENVDGGGSLWAPPAVFSNPYFDSFLGGH